MGILGDIKSKFSDFKDELDQFDLGGEALGIGPGGEEAQKDMNAQMLAPFQQGQAQSKALQDRWQQKGDAFTGRYANQAQATTIDPTQANQTRGMQLGLAAQLQDQAAGRGPSVAQAQLQQGNDAAIANQFAMARSLGGRAGSANRAAMLGAANLQQQNANQAGQLRAQEMLAGRSQLGALASGMRGQDMDMATNQAQMTQQNRQFNVGQSASQQARDDEMRRAYMGAELQASGQGIEALNGLGGAIGAANAATTAQKGATTGVIGSVLGSLSDKRAKVGIKGAGSEADDVLRSLSPKSYRYRDPNAPGAAPGEQLGVVAQDLERSRLGELVVRDTGQGKMIDVPQAAGLNLALAARLDERLRKLEGARG